jgi:predicted dehydrogenase
VYKQRGDVILAGKAGEEALTPMSIPPEFDAGWQAEAEFVSLCLGEIDEASFTFWDGVKNMDYLEAAYKSATEGRWVEVH